MGLRYYIDVDLLGVAKILVAVRADVTFPGDPGGLGIDGLMRPACTVMPSDKDVDWLGVVAEQGLTVVTRDRHIRSRPAEKQAIVTNSARVVTLDGGGGVCVNGTSWKSSLLNGESLRSYPTFRDHGFT